jgi:hypothetical protein
MKRIACFLLATALAAPAAQAHAPEREPAPAAAPALGHIDFPTSARSPQAQAAFIEGMLFLHVFEYESAKQSFLRAQQLEPGFALAYWGEAMTYTHPVWNQQDLGAGRAALARLAPTPDARAARAGSDRERDFLALTEILYGEDGKPERDRRALAHMEGMALRFPRDDEVQALLALALLGADEGVRNLPRFLRAADIARAVYRRNPRHAGAAHYWIHGLDDPAHAAGALEAARALSRIAPGAGHSQHMTSHIFIALGRWEDVVAANVAALEVVNAGLRDRQQPPTACMHYAEWLQYALFQLGREREGFRMLGDCRERGRAAVAWLRAHPGQAWLGNRDPALLSALVEASLARMRAATILESPQFRDAAGAPDPGLDAAAPESGVGLYADGLAQAWRDEPARARRPLARLRALAAAPAAPGDNGQERKHLALMATLLEGVIAQREGRGKSGLRKVAEAAQAFDALPYDFGPPALGLPPRELLGDLLLEAGRAPDAAAQYALALKSAPGRRRSLQGLDQALTRCARGRPASRTACRLP